MPIVIARAPKASRVALVALAVLTASLALAVPAWAFRDCCFARSTPPMVSGFFLPAADVRDGERQAARLGFRIDASPGLGVAQAGLDRGFITWTSAPIPEYGGIPAADGRPLVAGVMYPICGPIILPDRPAHSRPGAKHPNGALAVTGVIAVVADLDDACLSVPQLIPKYSNWPLVFEKQRVMESLGALSRTARTVDGGAVTLLAPLDPNGPVARWLAAGGPRWLGVAITVDDLHRTAAFFDRNEVAYERTEIEGLMHVIVPLTEGDRSPLAFFLQGSARRRPL